MQIKNSGGQILATALIVGAVIAILAYTLLFLFQQESKMLVKTMDITRKQELASIGMEHARYRMQLQNNWYNIPMTGFQYDEEYNIPGLGSYAVTIEKGNLFMTDSVRQGHEEYRTIGVKVKVYPSGELHQFYGVIKKLGYGGPLISKGKINLPCNNNSIDANGIPMYGFFWGDVYHANRDDDTFHFPYIPVGMGSTTPKAWGPAVYSASNIYTAYGKSGGNYQFGYVGEDMSPTAKSHPYSPMAIAPQISLQAYKQLAYEKGGYYGPATVGGSGTANPFYINDGLHDLADLNSVAIHNALKSTSDVLFVDTTDALPLRVPASPSNPTNTYCGTTYVSANTVAVYYNAYSQLYTVGSMIIQGPLILKGADPGPEPPNNEKDPLLPFWPTLLGIDIPSNYYYPQEDTTNHLEFDTKGFLGSALNNIKHAGFMYIDGELKIGGVRCKTSTCDNNTVEKTNAFASAKPSIFSKIKAAAAKLMEPPAVYANWKDDATATAVAIKTLTAVATLTPLVTNTPVATNTPGGPTETPTVPVPPTATVGVVLGTPTPPADCDGKTTVSDILIFGTLYIGEHGSLSIDTVNDTPRLAVYFNMNANAFSYLQNSVSLLSFRELTYLIPTPVPEYPF
ncbi:MAG: hypothetical protein JXR81_02265 [Candidatus Goldbacteria bacterium]|nr:hypothetical protein [Candidatus Goldiibacteriota bacterium]